LHFIGQLGNLQVEVRNIEKPFTCCQCGATFETEPEAISGCRADDDEMECPACYEQNEADDAELLADIAWATRSR
jgi:hypothetical protein